MTVKDVFSKYDRIYLRDPDTSWMTGGVILDRLSVPHRLLVVTVVIADFFESGTPVCNIVKR